MKVVLLLIGFSLLVAIGFLISFLWAVRSGQYDDDYTPSVRILFDDRQGDGPDDVKSAEDEENDNNNLNQ